MTLNVSPATIGSREASLGPPFGTGRLPSVGRRPHPGPIHPRRHPHSKRVAPVVVGKTLPGVDRDIHPVLTGRELQRVVHAAHLAVFRQQLRRKSGELGVVAAHQGAVRAMPGDSEDEVLDRTVDPVADPEAAGAAEGTKF